MDALRDFLSENQETASVSEKVVEEKHVPTLRDKINQEREEAQSHPTERKAMYNYWLPIIRSDVKGMKQREKLLNTYGFDVVETDADGNLIYREKNVRFRIFLNRRRRAIL